LKEIKTEFPRIPIIEYDAHGSRDTQLPILKDMIDRTRPYKKEYFEKQRRQEFLNMTRALKFKMYEMVKTRLPEDQRRAMEEFTKNFQLEMLQAVNQRTEIIRQRRSFWENIWNEKNKQALIDLGTRILNAFAPSLLARFFRNEEANIPLLVNLPPPNA